MKGLKTVSAIALLGFMVINPRVNAQTLSEVNIKPQIERMQVESNPNPDLTKNNEDVKNYLEPGIEQKEYQQAQADLNEYIEIDSSTLYVYLFKDFQAIELPTVAIALNTYMKS
ncbi:hypothetical protein [Calothrix sp. CCY 0018]|uniref:hypothetical protein n=1 Tax=Calothrix sp. CCY 0018 TaxID=3103864 RepID=UPI0039C759E3